ncbi:HEPN domain-containing protein [Leifsonia sp. NPDC056665]|uniref:HEPN domain-containing protein n=1 Tax=Leifsonia sp. NPDC056665 TaxID=3345901 RepID=UPI0036BD1F9F
MPSQAYERTWDPLLRDVQNLITLHPSQQGSPGRPAGDTGPLLRSTIVLLHTAWENYVEQLAIETVSFLLTNVTEHTALPNAQKERLSTLKNPWALAGDGWRTEARSAVEKEAARLNTPNIANTESLLNLAGYPNSMHEIKWRRTSNIKVRTEVDRFVHDIRGEIVHKGSTPGPLHKAGVESWI